MTDYWCPICHNVIPVRSPLPQAYGLVRSNHLRSHGIYTSRLTLKQKKSSAYIVRLWELQQKMTAMRAAQASVIFTIPKRDPQRCGLCDVEVKGSFEDHVKSEEHQSRLPRIKPVKIPEVPVRKVSEEEKQQNRDKIAKAVNLGYYGIHGRSHYEVRCECGQVTNLYCWSGIKRCPNCGKVISYYLSFKETTME